MCAADAHAVDHRHFHWSARDSKLISHERTCVDDRFHEPYEHRLHFSVCICICDVQLQRDGNCEWHN